MATTKANTDMSIEQGMAEGLKILARMIATAHRQRLRDAERLRGQCEVSPNVDPPEQSMRGGGTSGNK